VIIDVFNHSCQAIYDRLASLVPAISAFRLPRTATLWDVMHACA